MKLLAFGTEPAGMTPSGWWVAAGRGVVDGLIRTDPVVVEIPPPLPGVPLC